MVAASGAAATAAAAAAATAAVAMACTATARAATVCGARGRGDVFVAGEVGGVGGGEAHSLLGRRAVCTVAAALHLTLGSCTRTRLGRGRVAANGGSAVATPAGCCPRAGAARRPG